MGDWLEARERGDLIIENYEQVQLLNFRQPTFQDDLWDRKLHFGHSHNDIQ